MSHAEADARQTARVESHSQSPETVPANLSSSSLTLTCARVGLCFVAWLVGRLVCLLVAWSLHCLLGWLVAQLLGLLDGLSWMDRCLVNDNFTVLRGPLQVFVPRIQVHFRLGQQFVQVVTLLHSGEADKRNRNKRKFDLLLMLYINKIQIFWNL